MGLRPTTDDASRSRGVSRLSLIALLTTLVACSGQRSPHQPATSTERSATSVHDSDHTPPKLKPVRARPEEPRTPRVDCDPLRETGYRKGESFPIKVLTIDDKMVERRTAAAYWAMREAALAEGVELVIFSGFRSNEEQRYFYRCYRTCKCNNCNLAARPGYSNHQSGRALDIGQFQGVHEWLVANARRFGFRATIKSEPWHWEYRSGLKPDKSAWTPICPT